MANIFDQFDETSGPVVPEPVEKKISSLDQFDEVTGPNMFDQFDEAPQSEGQKALKSLMETATKAVKGGSTGGVSGAMAESGPDLISQQLAAEEKRLGPRDPIKFNVKDLANPVVNPINALGTVGKVAAREEAAVAQGAIKLTKAALDVSEGGDIKKFSGKKYWEFVKEAPKLLMEGMKEGLKGDSVSDADPERQAQFGDIPRLLGAPEVVSATLGLAASMALPSSLLMNAIPGAKYISKADNLAVNLVARNKWLAEFRAGTASLAKGKAMIEKLVTQDLEPDALVRLAQWRDALRKSTDAERAVKLMSRGEAKREVLEKLTDSKKLSLKLTERQVDKEATKVAGKKVYRPQRFQQNIGDMIVDGVVDTSPKTRAEDLVRTMHDTFNPVTAIKSIYKTKDYNDFKLRPYKRVVVANAKAVRQHEDQYLRILEESKAQGLTELSDESSKRIRLYDLLIQGKNDPAAKNASQILGQALGIRGVPKLNHAEKSFYAIAKKVVNERKANFSKAYEYVTGEEMKHIRDYVFPLVHEKDARTALQIYGENLPKGGGGVIGGGTTRFTGRTVNDSMPRTDVMKLLDEQLQAQAWMEHVLPSTRKARSFYTNSVLERDITTGDKEYIANLLNTVERGGTLTPSSGLERMIKAARGNITKAMLSYKVSSALVQYGALFDGAIFAHQLWGAQGASSFIKSMQENLFNPKTLKTVSTAIKNRMSLGSDAAIADLSTGAVKGKISRAGWAPMKRIDAQVAATVRDAFKKTLKKTGQTANDDDLDLLMELVSGSPSVAMQPSIIHSNELARMYFTFQTFQLNRWTLMAHNLIEDGVLANMDKRNTDIARTFSKLTKKELFDDQIKKQPFATITAWKGGADGMSDAANLRNMGKMEGILKRMGYRYKRASGGWYDPASKQIQHEPSLFVPGMSEEEAVALGKQFNQYSILSQNGEIRSDGLVRKTSNQRDVIIERGNKGGRITAENLPFTEVELGGETIRFHMPQGKNVMVRPGTLTKHAQGHDVLARRVRASIGLSLLAMADTVENRARQGIATMITGDEPPPKSVGMQMMTALPNQIPLLGNILNSVMNNSSALPPVPRVVEGMYKGAYRLATGKTESAKVRGAFDAATNAVALFAGTPGTSQIAQLIKRFLPEKG